MKLTFGTMLTRVVGGTTKETVVSINDDDVPAVTVSYGASTYSVAVRGTVSVKVKLSADPERTVEVPITATDRDGASSADYSGVPEKVPFNSGDTEKTFTIAATGDSADDDGESVSAEAKAKFGARRATLDPVALLHNIREAQLALAAMGVPKTQAHPQRRKPGTVSGQAA